MIEYEKKFGQVWKQLTNWNNNQVILGIMMCILPVQHWVSPYRVRMKQPKWLDQSFKCPEYKGKPSKKVVIRVYCMTVGMSMGP